MKVGLLKGGQGIQPANLGNVCSSQSSTQEFMSSEVSGLFLLKKTRSLKTCQIVSEEMNQGLKLG